MADKQLADASMPSAEDRYEWQSFLGLLPVLNLGSVDPVSYQRCLAGVWRLRGEETVSRRDLQQASGLEFQEQFELLLAQLIREHLLEPIVSIPFRFRIRAKHWTNPESAYGSDDRRVLIAMTRQEQAERFRILEELQQCLASGRLPDNRAQRLRKERDELQRMYDGTWLELGNAIGGEAAKVIRQKIERHTKPAARQIELPLEEEKNFNLEGEESCNR